MKKRDYTLLALLLISSAPLHAEEAESRFTLDETVVTATLAETSVSKVPAAIEIITAVEIAEMGAETLHQILAEAQSVTLEPTSGRQSVVRMRGLGSSSALVMLDGVRLPSGFQDKADLVEIPAGIIERIEIVRGPGSALYGSDAIAGVINVITKKPSGQSKAWLGSRYGESRHGEAEETVFDAGVSGSTGSLGYVLAGSFSDKGRFDFDSADRKTDGDDMRIASGAGRLVWQAGDRTVVSLGAIYAEVEREGIRPKRNKENDWYNNSDRFTGSLELQHELGESSELLLRLSRSEYDWGLKLIPRDNTASELHDVEQVSTQFEGRWRGKVIDGHIVTAGMEYRADDRIDDGLESEIENFALFLQDEVSVGERFYAVLGLRYDDHSGFGSVFSPRINLAYRVSDLLRLRAAYGEGFRAPTAFELYSGSPYTINRILIPDPDLEPETSRTWEVGADLKHGGLSLGLTAFRNDIRDMIAEVFTGSYEGTNPKIPVNSMENIADAMTQGLEVSASLTLPGGFELSDELTWLESEDKATGEDLLYVPDLSNVLKLSWRNKPAGFNGSVRLVTIGTRSYGAGVKSAGYSMVNLQASKTLTSQVKVSAGVDNVFDRKVEDAYGNVYGPGSTGTFYYGGISLNL
ncbi:MAG: TonB-dependent receptor [Chlorobiaceae bacterium]|nr:TonB-dependent receptor [Chlorobiaceae bacterium]